MLTERREKKRKEKEREDEEDEAAIRSPLRLASLLFYPPYSSSMQPRENAPRAAAAAARKPAQCYAHF